MAVGWLDSPATSEGKFNSCANLHIYGCLTFIIMWVIMFDAIIWEETKYLTYFPDIGSMTILSISKKEKV